MTPNTATVKKIIRIPRRRGKQVKTRLSYFEPDQLEKCLKAAREHGNREWAMFLFGVAHGARASEIANLRISDLNLRQETIHVARLKGSLDSVQNFMKVKGNPLFDEEKAFRTWLAERKPDADNFVFNSQKSTQLNRVTVFKLFRLICKKAGLPESLAHPHVLKHTAAMLLVKQNTNAFLIRQHLGHRSFESTLQYVNASDKQASEAASKAFSEIF
jgi:integrase/recombinase XerD